METLPGRVPAGGKSMGFRGASLRVRASTRMPARSRQGDLHKRVIAIVDCLLRDTARAGSTEHCLTADGQPGRRGAFLLGMRWAAPLKSGARLNAWASFF